MPYIREVCRAGKTIEIHNYYTYRWGPDGRPRKKPEKLTTEQQQKINLRKAIMTLRRILNATFSDEHGDLLVTLDYKQILRPVDSREMQKHVATFIRELRKEYNKAGETLKYVYVKEIGKRGACHIHMVLTHCDTKVLRRCWKRGGVDVKPLWTDGQYARIAEYFIKYSAKTEETEGQLVGKRFYASRNVTRPVPVKMIISRSNTFRAAPAERKGYYVEPESVLRGINELGYEYLAYTLHELPGRGQIRERSEKDGEKRRTRAPAGSGGADV